MIDYSYLSPPHQARKIKRLKQYQFQIINGKPHRRIFQNVEYNLQQKQQISNTKQYLKQKQPDRQYQDHFILKMIYLTEGANPLNVYENIRRHGQWFSQELICNLNRDQGRRILMQGVFYSFGRDQEYSPVIYVYPCRINTSKYSLVDYCNALHMLLAPIQQFMLVPGIIESYNIVIDMEHKKFHLPFNTMRETIEKVVFAFPFRLKKIFFVNTKQNDQLSKGINQILQIYNYKIKPQFIQNMSDFRRYITDEQRQQKYGGSLQDLNQYWPISLATKYQEQKSYFLVEQTSETDFQSVINDHVFFQSLQQSELGCGRICGKNCEIY